MGKTGRPKKTDSDVLIRLVEDYFANEGHGNPAALQCTKLAKYARKCGVDANDYDFRRDSRVMERIQELKQDQQGFKPVGTTAYRNLDIEGLIRSCSDLSILRRKLYELDAYWRSVYASAEETRAEVRKLHRTREELTKQTEELKRNADAVVREKDAFSSANKALEKENAYLRKQIRTYLYPALANELLSQSNLPSVKSKDVRPEAVTEMIEGRTPLPFGGNRGSFRHERTRVEELEAQMKAQVRDGQ